MVGFLPELSVAVVLGLPLGALANHAVDRLPERRALGSFRRTCPACGHELGVPETVSVVGLLFRRRRCRNCGTAFPIHYYLVEIMTVLGLAGVFWSAGLNIRGIFYVPFVWTLVAAGFIDYRHRIIPKRLLGAGLLAGLVLGIPASLQLLPALYGAVAGFGLLWLLSNLWPGGLGGGDVKLGGFLGFYLGWPGIMAGLALGFVLGALVACALLALRRVKLRDTMAYGPFLAAGAYVAFLGWQHILKWVWPVLGR